MVELLQAALHVTKSLQRDVLKSWGSLWLLLRVRHPDYLGGLMSFILVPPVFVTHILGLNFQNRLLLLLRFIKLLIGEDWTPLLAHRLPRRPLNTVCLLLFADVLLQLFVELCNRPLFIGRHH